MGVWDTFLKDKAEVDLWLPRLVKDDRFWPQSKGDMLYAFFGENRWMSNFHIQPLVYEGKEYQSTEAAYQAAKTDNPEIKEQIRLSSPAGAKKLGNCLNIRKDWEEVKWNIMSEIVALKFLASQELQLKLLKTYPLYLVEGNTWHDNGYGICIHKDCRKGCWEKKGKNMLGKILMEIRQALYEQFMEEATEALLGRDIFMEKKG